MSALTIPGGMKDSTNGTPLLREGDRLGQLEFHRRYLQYPDHIKFELVGGVVYMASPLGLPHSRFDGKVGLILELYECDTLGTEVLHNVTTILGAPPSTANGDHALTASMSNVPLVVSKRAWKRSGE